MSEIGKKYMVTFDIPVFLEDNIEYILDNQKKALDAYFYQGKVFSCTLSMDLSSLWMIVLSSSESELLSILDDLPISQFCDYDYKELVFHKTVQFIPEHSLN